MSDDGTNTRFPKLLLEHEVAARLRCSLRRVWLLRSHRLISYYRTYPITISEDDLAEYIARAKYRKPTPRKARYVVLNPPDAPRSQPVELLTDAEAAKKYDKPRSYIRRLRMCGRIPYLPRYRAPIDAADLADYFEECRLAALAKLPPAPDTPEFAALQKKRDDERLQHRLRVIGVRRTFTRYMKGQS